MTAGHEVAEVTGELVPIVLFLMIGAIVVGNRYFRHKERTQMQETLRAAYERGQTVQPELLAMMASDPRPLKPIYGPERDLRRGLFWMAWAFALLAAGGAFYYYDSSNDTTGAFMGFACFPGFVGLAYLIIYFLTRGKSRG
jgi:hypothetical protein